LPAVRHRIKIISQYIGERERETHFRLKLFKNSNRSPSREGGTISLKR
jgi:vacuolar-type H+-ATPase subunit D/Vma8